MKKVEISITDETGDVRLYDVSGLLQPIDKMSGEESYRYHTMCARATLYPNKTMEEVSEIIENDIKKYGFK
jgi:hypothetical protein